MSNAAIRKRFQHGPKSGFTDGTNRFNEGFDPRDLLKSLTSLGSEAVPGRLNLTNHKDYIVMDDRLQTHIGQKLKSLYDGVLSEPIPDRFAQLLQKLEQTERKSPPARSDS